MFGRSQPYRSMRTRRVPRGAGLFHRPYTYRTKYGKLAMRAYNKLLTSRSGGSVSREFRMPQSAAYSWEAQKGKDADWTPLETSRYGQHRRVFTKEEEEQIADHIRKEVLPTGSLFTDEDCRRMLIQKYHEKVLKNPGCCVPFTCSHGSVTDFKRRHGFAS